MQASQETTLVTIEVAARRLREARDEVATIVTRLNRQILALQTDAVRDIKRTVAKTADRHAELHNLVDGARHLFIKPRTQTFHGVTCGLAKGKGSIEFDDEDQVVAAVEKKLPDMKDALIKIEKSIVKSSLKNLTVDDLKRIGCTVEETGDYIVIRFSDKEVDKFVNALLKNAVAETTEAAAA